MSVTILTGDTLAMLPTLGAGSVQTCVTSPPYWGLRDYGHAGQLGLEPTPEQYVARMVAVFADVRRVLRDDGTLWLNLGDSYATGGTATAPSAKSTLSRHGSSGRSPYLDALGTAGIARRAPDGLKPKDLVGIPWRVAFALQADGWYLRSDIIWAKPNPMPESVTDRPTKSHEYVFLLAKSERYAYDAEAVKEEAVGTPGGGVGIKGAVTQTGGQHSRTLGAVRSDRNARSVWTIATQPYRGAHFATMPPALAEKCILAGSKPGDMVLDPFGGAGTTGLVADRLGRNATLIELNPEYAALARTRIDGDCPLFADGAA